MLDTSETTLERIIFALKHVHLSLDYELSPSYPDLWEYEIGRLYAQRDGLLHQLRYYGAWEV